MPDGASAARAASELPRLSRALLTPGPLPPLSHLGVTLLRHAVGSGLRWTFYQLGLPLPEAPPVRIVRLRLYLDAGRLEALLAGTSGGTEVAAALLDPGGAGTLPGEARRLAAAAAFHRARLRLLPRRPSPLPAPGGAPASLLYERFRSGLSRLLPAVNEALLAELLAALDRRARRARGQEVPPALGREARRLRDGRPTRLDRLGVPDPLAPSWAERPEHAEQARRALADEPLPPADPLRGRFREAWRGALSALAPHLHALGASAAARGLLADPVDTFFLPLDLVEDLARDTRPPWLEAAVRTNRAEHASLQPAAEPLDRMRDPADMAAATGARPDQAFGAVVALP